MSVEQRMTAEEIAELRAVYEASVLHGRHLGILRTAMPRLLDEHSQLVAFYNRHVDRISYLESLLRGIGEVENDDYGDDYHEMKALAAKAFE